MISVFWSPLHGQTCTTTNILTISLLASTVFKKNVLLTQTQFDYNNLEAPLIGSNTKNNASSVYFRDVGLDALVRSFKASRLELDSVSNCCIAIPNTKLILLPGTEKSNRESFEYDMQLVSGKLFKDIDDFMEATFIDVGPAENFLSLKLMETADLVVVNLSQNIKTIDTFFSKYRDRIKGKVFYLFGSYDRNSKYNISNIRRKYKEIHQANSGVIPYNTSYRDSMMDGKTNEFIRNNLNCGKYDENNYFMMKSRNATEKILKIAGLMITAEEVNGTG